jgi:pyruvate dehydrogenase E1 component
LREALRAQELLEKHFNISSTVYSVTSYKALYMDGRDADHWNRLHPDEPPRQPYVTEVLDGDQGPIVAASDYVSAVPLSISAWVGPDYAVLGTDGFGRSEARKELRRFFEVDAENIALTALYQLAGKGQYPRDKLTAAINTLGIDPNKPNSMFV